MSRGFIGSRTAYRLPRRFRVLLRESDARSPAENARPIPSGKGLHGGRGRPRCTSRGAPTGVVPSILPRAIRTGQPPPRSRLRQITVSTLPLAPARGCPASSHASNLAQSPSDASGAVAHLGADLASQLGDLPYGAGQHPNPFVQQTLSVGKWILVSTTVVSTRSLRPSTTPFACTICTVLVCMAQRSSSFRSAALVGEGQRPEHEAAQRHAATNPSC